MCPPFFYCQLTKGCDALCMSVCLHVCLYVLLPAVVAALGWYQLFPRPGPPPVNVLLRVVR